MTNKKTPLSRSPKESDEDPVYTEISQILQDLLDLVDYQEYKYRFDPHYQMFYSGLMKLLIECETHTKENYEDRNIGR